MAEAQSEYRHNLDSHTAKLILGVVIVLSLAEFAVFLATYGYEMILAIRYPEPGSSRILGFVMLGMFIVIRSMFIPTYLQYNPLFSNGREHHASIVFEVTLWILVVWAIAVLSIPPTLTMYYWWRYGLGSKKLEIGDPEKFKWYKVIVVVPVYRESEKLLRGLIRSLAAIDYPEDMIEFHIAFDEESITQEFEIVMDALGARQEKRDDYLKHTDLQFSGKQFYVHRWAHGGKRETQGKTWGYISTLHAMHDPEDMCLMLCDSDNDVYSTAIHNYVVTMNRELIPRSGNTKVALAGYMTCISSGSGRWNPMRVLQDTEYVVGEICRTLEVMLGDVNCLPGAMTFLKYEVLQRLGPIYFGGREETNLIDAHRRVLGEDRYLTHLIQQYYPVRSIGFAPAARAKTEPCATLQSLVRQRRRWLLGAISNESYMLINPGMWRKMPLLLAVKLMIFGWRSSIISQGLMAFGCIYAYFVMPSSSIPKTIPATFVPYAIGWIGITIISIRIKHYKVPFIWPFFLLFGQFYQLVIDVYTTFTFTKIAWGGARSAAASDSSAVSEAGTDEVEKKDGDDIISTVVELRSPTDSAYGSSPATAQVSALNSEPPSPRKETQVLTGEIDGISIISTDSLPAMMGMGLGITMPEEACVNDAYGNAKAETGSIASADSNSPMVARVDSNQDADVDSITGSGGGRRGSKFKMGKNCIVM
ncbi:hypothetical protein SAICODRAFT_16179 [Saitoella complicata NRRL Y-17804]|nr:uncharacterized protein SAICODRAFT_16179 [Saitoella complicata NRRL Y-17804]ODQ56147.1 hypothetical protein SAICODRAFT_16179 [Saitoella complicata NRRL Y-17804]